LPPTTEFTYCVELKAEGYKDVEFADPVIIWVQIVSSQAAFLTT